MKRTLLVAGVALGVLGFALTSAIMTGFFNLNPNVIKVQVGNELREVDLEGKTFEEVCSATSGFWMMDIMGMAGTRDGVPISSGPCSGCMPNMDNMFCNKDEYVEYVKQNGVSPDEMEQVMAGQ